MNKWKLPKADKEQLIDAVQNYFEVERSESIGNLAAEQLLEYMLSKLGPFVYNQAIEDARKVLLERSMAMEDELYSLEKPIHSR